jgi:hypothetical protein
MDLSKIATVDLVAELASRAEKVDQLYAALATLGGEKPARKLQVRTRTQPVAKTPRGRRPKRRKLKGDMVLEAFKAAGRPLTVKQAHRKLRKGTVAGMVGQVRRLCEEGKLKKLGDIKPHTYQVV